MACPAASATAIWTVVAPACLCTFASASAATSSAAASTVAGRRPGQWQLSCVGIGARRASVASAGSSPSSLRIAGCTPRAGVRFVDRVLQLGIDLGELRVEPRGVAVAAVAREPHGQPEPEQCLLRAVVEVALDPAALGVGRRHEPRARLPHLEQSRAQLGLQARVLQREPRRRGHRLEQLGVLEQRRVVDQGGERLVVVVQYRDAPARVVGQHDGRTVGVDVTLAVGQPERELQRRVAERTGEQIAQRGGPGRGPELDHEVRDHRPVLARAQHADHHADRDQAPRVRLQCPWAPVREPADRDPVVSTTAYWSVPHSIGARARRAGALAQTNDEDDDGQTVPTARRPPRDPRARR